jgi:hypothetical protein
MVSKERGRPPADDPAHVLAQFVDHARVASAGSDRQRLEEGGGGRHGRTEVT